MDYEKKYKDTLADIQELYNSMKYMSSTDALHITTALERAFPELKESEDKNWIPKEIIKYLKEKGDFRSCWIAWLEKQGKKNPIIEETFVNINEVREDFIQEVYRVLNADPTNDRANQIIDAFDHLPTIIIQNPIDKVEPKFNIGDTIIKKYNSDINKFGKFTITAIIDNKYWYRDKIICDINEQDEWELIKQSTAVWSEDDETKLKSACAFIRNTSLNGNEDVVNSTIDWLKSLKERMRGE